MKKIRILILSFIIALSVVACQDVNAETTTTYATTTTWNTTIPDTTVTIDDGSKTYVYESYQDLLDQIYQDVYNDIYQDVYDDVELMLTEQLYEEIYQAVSDNLVIEFSDEEIGVYIAALQSKIYDIADIVDNTVVGVSTYEGTTGVSMGTGVVYSFNSSTNTYYLITNHHVIDGGDNYRIVFADDSYVVGTLLGFDDEIDIAILSFNGALIGHTITPVTLADSDDVLPGTLVIAAGNPQGYDFFGSVTLGIVAGVNRDVEGDGVVGYIQHDAPINAGNSGGPLFNLNGEVIGINVSKFASTDIEGMGFSIPINLVIQVIQTVAPTSLN
ncbi:MAG: trypsin-like peptidase domain-containing protein [Firmicutes bacterium]|nr:trypsin-like peptidase domain-containing protein [Bacillota bacterium]